MNTNQMKGLIGALGFIIFLSSILFIGLTMESPEGVEKEVPLGETISEPNYYYDGGGEVVCYTNKGSTSGGISCLPVNQTAYNVSDFQ